MYKSGSLNMEMADFFFFPSNAKQLITIVATPGIFQVTCKYALIFLSIYLCSLLGQTMWKKYNQKGKKNKNPWHFWALPSLESKKLNRLDITGSQMICRCNPQAEITVPKLWAVPWKQGKEKGRNIVKSSQKHWAFVHTHTPRQKLLFVILKHIMA